MVSLPVGKTTYPVSRETKWRHRFTILTAVVTVLLLAWGGVVTSIDAGMAFPDWPTSLGSYNWLNPVDRWWANPAYLAEHGHRILGSVTGLLTLTLAVWTWQTDPRAWMRWLSDQVPQSVKDWMRPYLSFRWLPGEKVSRPDVSAEVRARLEETLRPDAEALRDLTGRAFGDWSV
ncbi:MAG: hypothetical protein BRD40_02395 [Bacteroidetes bacterium QS_1_65_9]|nr:MAG: hypothetical protein BRD40_02395 [Bacteroidetes bacterium QS_1_65_9]